MEYPSNVECVWKITVPDNAVLQLTFQEFDTECSHDYLEIHFMRTEEGTVERCALKEYTYSYCIIIISFLHLLYCKSVCKSVFVFLHSPATNVFVEH